MIFCGSVYADSSSCQIAAPVMIFYPDRDCNIRSSAGLNPVGLVILDSAGRHVVRVHDSDGNIWGRIISWEAADMIRNL